MTDRILPNGAGFDTLFEVEGEGDAPWTSSILRSNQDYELYLMIVSGYGKARGVSIAPLSRNVMEWPQDVVDDHIINEMRNVKEFGEFIMELALDLSGLHIIRAPKWTEEGYKYAFTDKDTVVGVGDERGIFGGLGPLTGQPIWDTDRKVVDLCNGEFFGLEGE